MHAGARCGADAPVRSRRRTGGGPAPQPPPAPGPAARSRPAAAGRGPRSRRGLPGAEHTAEVAPQRVQVDVLAGLVVASIPVVLAPALGAAHLDPVGRPVAGPCVA